MRKLISLLGATLALGGAVEVAAVATAAPATAPPVAIVAKTCHPGYTHAVIGGAQKCLHAGEFCAHSHAQQYRHYHYKCVREGGTYRLKRT